MKHDPERLCQLLDYSFSDPTMLLNALTHSSYCYEHQMKYSENNERLEFLGDAVFDALIAEQLYHVFSEKEEGGLSKMRASIVCEQSLFRKASELNLREYMRLGQGELSQTSESRYRSLVADSLEAIIGAIYLDGGWEEAKRVVLRLFADIIEDALEGRLKQDYKSALQEYLQAAGSPHISYQVERETGPDHDKTFYVVMKNHGAVLGKGSGHSKKSAEQNAAMDAWNHLHENTGV